MTREEALYWLDHSDLNKVKFYEAVGHAIEALQQQKTGRWLGGELGECSVCGHKGCASDIWDRCKDFYCHNCGARLNV